MKKIISDFLVKLNEASKLCNAKVATELFNFNVTNETSFTLHYFLNQANSAEKVNFSFTTELKTLDLSMYHEFCKLGKYMDFLAVNFDFKEKKDDKADGVINITCATNEARQFDCSFFLKNNCHRLNQDQRCMRREESSPNTIEYSFINNLFKKKKQLMEIHLSFYYEPVNETMANSTTAILTSSTPASILPNSVLKFNSRKLLIENRTFMIVMIAMPIFVFLAIIPYAALRCNRERELYTPNSSKSSFKNRSTFLTNSEESVIGRG